MNNQIQQVGEYIKFESWNVYGKPITVISGSVCVSTEPLIGVEQNNMYEDLLNVYNFDTEEYVSMSKSALLKAIGL